MTSTDDLDPRDGGFTPSALGDEALLAAPREGEVRSRRLYATKLRLLAEIDARGVAEARGYGGAGALLREITNTGPVAARAVLEQARVPHPGHAPSGAEIPARLPATAEALAQGVLGAEHVAAIGKAIAALPRDTAEADVREAETILCEAAVSAPPRVLARLGREIALRLDPDGRRPDEKDLARPRRWLAIQQQPDGRVSGRFSLDAEAGALLTNLLSPLTAPRPDEAGVPAQDTLGKDERYGDALAEVLRLAAKCPDTPGEAGDAVTVLITAHIDDLRHQLGHGLLDGYLAVPAAQVRRMACDAKVLPLVLGGASRPLDLGRSARTVSRNQRKALIARDGGCTFPGCDRKAKWCQAHHIRHWIDHGPTDLANLALICPHHHRAVHHTDWRITMINGMPWSVPPVHLDPERTPRRNTLHTHRAGRPHGGHHTAGETTAGEAA